MLRRVNEIFDRRWLTNDGPMVREFERRVAELAGVKHCIAMCNATVALEIAIRALEFRGEVIVPSYTFVATAHALQRQEIVPVFADMDPQTHLIDPASVERLITPRTTGIIGVHVWGRTCNVEALTEISARHGLKLMFDAAHAFGCSRGGKMVGRFGACEIFSFHATKFVNCFEGGAVATNDDVLAEKIRLMRNFGFKGYDRVVYLGTNGKMTEICAAMGLTSLEALDGIVATNRQHYELYGRELAGVEGISLVTYDPAEQSNYHYIVLQINPDVCPLSRDEVVEVLHAENILARKYFWPGCHRMEPYKTVRPDAHLLLPETERVAAQVIVLPTGQTLSSFHIRKISDVIKNALTSHAEVRARLRNRGSAVYA